MTTIDTAKLDGLTLAKGSHESPDEGLCLMEAVAYVRGIGHTDRPPCVSPVLGTFGRNLNDVLPDDLRQRLVPLIPDLPGTVGDGHDEQRSYMALDWLIRTWLPAWLELSPACREDAAKIRELGRIVDLASAERAGPIVRRAQSAAAAAWAAAWDAARAAARDAARDAAGDAARDAAGDAAWAAARNAAGDAARAAAGDAARDAAGDAAWAAARAAAGDAARDAAGAAARAAAWAAAWAAAGDALAPTVAALQESAIDLYAHMTRIGAGR